MSIATYLNKEEIEKYSNIKSINNRYKNKSVYQTVNLMISSKYWFLKLDRQIVLNLLEILSNLQLNTMEKDFFNLIQDFLKIHYGNIDIVNMFLKLRQLSSSRSIEYFALRYGDELGLKKYQEKERNRNKNSRIGTIKRRENVNYSLELNGLKDNQILNLKMISPDSFYNMIINTPRFRFLKNKREFVNSLYRIYLTKGKITYDIISIYSDIIRNNNGIALPIKSFKKYLKTKILKTKYLIRYGNNYKKIMIRKQILSYKLNIFQRRNKLIGQLCKGQGIEFFNLTDDIRMYNTDFVIRNVLSNKDSNKSYQQRLVILKDLKKNHKQRIQLIYGDNYESFLVDYLENRTKYNKHNLTIDKKIDLLFKNNFEHRDEINNLISLFKNELFISFFNKRTIPKICLILNKIKEKYGTLNKFTIEYLKLEKNKKFFFLLTSKEIEIYNKKISDVQITNFNKRKKLYNKYASKESLLLFRDIYENLKDMHKIFIGFENSREYRLSEIKEGKLIHRFYDFTILDKKIIIEYNGITWHPRLEKMQEDEITIWKMPHSNITAIEKYQQDIDKVELAKKEGFDVLVLWSDDSFEYNKEKILNFLKEKGIFLNEKISI